MLKLSKVDIEAVLRANNDHILLSKLDALANDNYHETLMLASLHASGRMTIDMAHMTDTRLRHQIDLARQLGAIYRTSRTITGATLYYMLNGDYLVRQVNGPFEPELGVLLRGMTCQQHEAYAEVVEEMLRSPRAIKVYEDNAGSYNPGVVKGCLELMNLIRSGQVTVPTISDIIHSHH